jgi:hypothetical protein
MELLALIGLIIFLLVAYPMIQEQRERKLAERLERLHDPNAAAALVDAATAESASGVRTLGWLKRWFWPRLFR